MEDTLLIKTLRTFDNKQLGKLHKFLLSHYSKKDHKSLELFEYLQKFKPHFQHKNLNKEIVAKHFFSEKKEIENQIGGLTKLTSQLYGLVQKFISYLPLEEPEKKIELETNILDYYRKHDLDDLFERKLRKLIKKQKKIDPFDDSYYHDAFLINNSLFSYYSKNGDYKKCGETLKKCLENLEISSLITQLNYSCLALNYAKVFEMDLASFSFDLLIKQVESKKYTDIAIVNIYYHAMLVLKNQATESFFLKYKDLLHTYSSKLSRHEARQLYVYAKNYCSSKTSLGEDIYYRYYFDIYQSELKTGIIYDNGQIQAGDLRNIITVALVLKELDWASKFLEEHRNKIMGEDKEDVYWYNKANLLFYQGAYEAALELIKQLSFKSQLYKVAAKRLKIKLLYELREIEELDRISNNFRVAISRDKILAERNKVRNQNFINLLISIVGIARKDINRIKKIENRIRSTKELMERQWLLEKLEELK